MKTDSHLAIHKPFLFISLILLVLLPTALAQYNSENVTLMGRWPYGDSRTAFAYGNYVCVGNGTSMDVLDVSDPNNPVLEGQLITESIISGIHVSGDYAYIANWSDGFKVIDVSTPSEPTEVASIPFEGQSWDVSIFGNFAYVGNDTLGMRIVDISNPLSPTLRGTFDPPGTVKIEYIQVIDTLAYAASLSGLFIVNISNPDSPDQIAYFAGNGSYHVNVANNVAYLPEFGDGLHMVDVTNPYFPIDMGYFDTQGFALWVEVSGNYAYVANGYSGLYVLDVTDPVSPDSVVILNTDNAYAFNIQGNYLYLADGPVGFKVIDISDPTSPIGKGSYDTGGYQMDVYASNNLLFAAQRHRGLSIINIANPNSPTEIATLDMAVATALHGYGDYIYVIDDGDLRIIDVNIPGSPQEVGFWGGGFRAVYVTGNYAYLGGWPDLTILDISNPSLPIWVGELDGLPDAPFVVYVTGDYAYLSNGSGGLRIINVSAPSFPFEEGVFDEVDNVVAVHVSGSYAYLADRWVGLLRVINISTPSIPFEESTFYTQEARDVHVSGEYAYVINPWTGVRVIDISDPLNMSEAGFFDTKGYARKVYFDNYIYVANGAGGLYLLENVLDPVGVNDENASPVSFSLSQNYPNPFNPATKIKYQISELSFVTIKVYDVLGSEIATLINEEKPIGSYEVEFSATGGLPSGIYFYRINAGDFIEAKKMVLLK